MSLSYCLLPIPLGLVTEESLGERSRSRGLGASWNGSSCSEESSVSKNGADDGLRVTLRWEALSG